MSSTFAFAQIAVGVMLLVLVIADWADPPETRLRNPSMAQVQKAMTEGLRVLEGEPACERWMRLEP